MILAVNIGNTNVRAAIGEKKHIEAVAVLPTDELNSAEDFNHFLNKSFGEKIWRRVEGSIISTVVPQKNSYIKETLIQGTGKIPKTIERRSLSYINASQYDGLLGEDRIVCCAGVLSKYEPPFILVDFGTATTVNVVNEKSEFLGGAILPGVKTGIKALSDNTAQLMETEIEGDIPVIGKNTRENLLSGAIIGLALAVEGYISLIEGELGSGFAVVVTGGHAPLVLPYCRFPYTHEPDLLPKGLFALYYEI